MPDKFASDRLTDWWNSITNRFGSEPLPILPAEQAALDRQATSTAMGDIATTAGVGLAAGAGVRGLMGLGSMFGRPETDLRRALGPQVIQISTPVYAKKRDEERARAMAKISSPWWTIPGLTFAGIGGLAGGYKLTDMMLQRKRKADLAAEVEDAQKKYQEALLGQYSPDRIPVVPTAAPMKLGSLKESLNKMSESIEKTVTELFPKQAGLGENALGIMATIGGLLALGSGVAGYNLAKSRSQPDLIEKAIKQRERERFARRPPEIYAVPQPVHLTRGGDFQTVGEAPDLTKLGTEKQADDDDFFDLLRQLSNTGGRDAIAHARAGTFRPEADRQTVLRKYFGSEEPDPRTLGSGGQDQLLENQYAIPGTTDRPPNIDPSWFDTPPDQRPFYPTPRSLTVPRFGRTVPQHGSPGFERRPPVSIFGHEPAAPRVDPELPHAIAPAEPEVPQMTAGLGPDLTKLGTEKQGLLDSLLGGSIGALSAPSGHRWEGASRGVGRAAGTGTGVVLGAGTGGLMGAGLGAGLGGIIAALLKQGPGVGAATGVGAAGGASLGALTGAGLGGLLGGLKGWKTVGRYMGPASYDSDNKKEKKADAGSLATLISSIAGHGVNGLGVENARGYSDRLPDQQRRDQAGYGVVRGIVGHAGMGLGSLAGLLLGGGLGAAAGGGLGALAGDRMGTVATPTSAPGNIAPLIGALAGAGIGGGLGFGLGGYHGGRLGLQLTDRDKNKAPA